MLASYFPRVAQQLTELSCAPSPAHPSSLPRAELAHTLELLILGEPLSSASDVDRTSRFTSQLPGLWEQLVVQHPIGLHLPTSVLRVFVSIEVTGQSVTFEDKFKYRGPM